MSFIVSSTFKIVLAVLTYPVTLCYIKPTLSWSDIKLMRLLEDPKSKFKTE